MSDERAERTRIDKAIDFLLGEFCGMYENAGGNVKSATAVMLLEATAHRTSLLNRTRLLELVEAAMPKEAKP